MNIAFRLPEGFRPAPKAMLPPSSADGGVAYLRRVPGAPRTVLAITPSGGLKGNETIDKDHWRSNGAVDFYKEEWKGHEVQAIVLRETLEGQPVFTHVALVPTRPEAIQISVTVGQANRGEALGIVQSVLNSLEGESLSPHEASAGRPVAGLWALAGLGRLGFWMVVIAVLVRVAVRKNEKRFRERAVAAGVDRKTARRRIVPGWGRYLLGAYALLAGLVMGSFAVAHVQFLRFSGRSDHLPWLLLGAGSALAGLVAMVLVFRSTRRKRRRLMSEILHEPHRTATEKTP